MGRTNANTVKNKKTCQIWDKFKQRIPLTILCSLCCAVVLSIFGLILQNDPLVSMLIDTINNDSYMNIFYTHYNDEKNSRDTAPYEPDNIIIVDVKDSFSSRKNISAIIESVAAQKPRLIFVDCFFAENDSYDESQNETLQKTIANIKDSVELVFVGYRNDKYEFKQSFFTKSLDLQFGASNFSGFGEFVPYYDSVPRISLKIAALLGADTAKLPPHFITNYRTKKYNSLCVPDSLGLDTLSDINHNDIVLIGQLSSPYDLHTSPFVVKNNGHSISGIETIAYELSSILAYDEKAKSKDCEYPYITHSCPSLFWSIGTYLIFSFLYACVYLLVDIWMEKRRHEKIWRLFCFPLLLLIVEFCIVHFCFLITKSFFIVPNISLLIASLLFVEPSYNFSKQ